MPPYTLQCSKKYFPMLIFPESTFDPDMIAFIGDAPFYGNRYGSFFLESDLEACNGAFLSFLRKVEPRRECIGAPTSSSLTRITNSKTMDIPMKPAATASEAASFV